MENLNWFQDKPKENFQNYDLRWIFFLKMVNELTIFLGTLSLKKAGSHEAEFILKIQ